MAIKFSPEVLRSDKSLNAYLYGKEIIEAIKAEAKQPYVPKGCGRLGTLEVVWSIGTLPLNIISSLFLQTIGNLLYLLYARELSQKLLVQANYIDQTSVRWIPSVLYGKNLLVSTVNALSPDKAEEVYTHPPIPMDKVHPNILYRSHSYHNTDHQLAFDDIGGQCLGMSNWAAHLYFETKDVFTNKEHHLIAVTSKLANGAGKEAALWQQMQKNGYDRQKEKKYISNLRRYISKIDRLFHLVKVKFGRLEKLFTDHELNEMKSDCRYYKALIRGFDQNLSLPLGIKRTPIDHLIKPTAEKVAQVFKDLQPGFYSICIPKHRFNFIKGRFGESDYIMEPNRGLIAIRSAKEFEKHTKESLADKSEVDVSLLRKAD